MEGMETVVGKHVGQSQEGNEASHEVRGEDTDDTRSLLSRYSSYS